MRGERLAPAVIPSRHCPSYASACAAGDETSSATTEPMRGRFIGAMLPGPSRVYQAFSESAGHEPSSSGQLRWGLGHGDDKCSAATGPTRLQALPLGEI